ncbi:MAG: DUF6249 domain-containing protein [Gemmatimonadales bacterium]
MFAVETIVPLGLFISAAYIIVTVTRIISDGRMRRRLLEAGVTPELAKTLATPQPDDPGLFRALRWGIVLGSVGIALILIQFLPYRVDDPIAFGLILVFGGAGLLTYHVSARRLMRKA